MSKITIDIEYIKESLEDIGYVVSDCLERDNNGINWQIKFSNSGAIVTIYDTNNKKNSVVNGKCDEAEKSSLKEIVDGLKCKELFLDEKNGEIVSLINSRREDSFYDFKREWVDENKYSNLLHDILCLSNNLHAKTAYLIIGVCDDYSICGVEDWKKSNDFYDWYKTIKFAGDIHPNIQLKRIYYKYKKLDALAIEITKQLPYFLSDGYKDVMKYHIYTRYGDTNTPKGSQADYLDIEKMWEYHFEL